MYFLNEQSQIYKYYWATSSHISSMAILYTTLYLNFFKYNLVF